MSLAGVRMRCSFFPDEKWVFIIRLILAHGKPRTQVRNHAIEASSLPKVPSLRTYQRNGIARIAV
jgi:hypothetical protein